MIGHRTEIFFKLFCFYLYVNAYIFSFIVHPSVLTSLRHRPCALVSLIPVSMSLYRCILIPYNYFFVYHCSLASLLPCILPILIITYLHAYIHKYLHTFILVSLHPCIVVSLRCCFLYVLAYFHSSILVPFYPSIFSSLCP